MKIIITKNQSFIQFSTGPKPQKCMQQSLPGKHSWEVALEGGCATHPQSKCNHTLGNQPPHSKNHRDLEVTLRSIANDHQQNFQSQNKSMAKKIKHKKILSQALVPGLKISDSEACQMASPAYTPLHIN